MIINSNHDNDNDTVFFTDITLGSEFRDVAFEDVVIDNSMLYQHQYVLP